MPGEENTFLQKEQIRVRNFFPKVFFIPQLFESKVY